MLTFFAAERPTARTVREVIERHQYVKPAIVHVDVELARADMRRRQWMRRRKTHDPYIASAICALLLLGVAIAAGIVFVGTS